MRRARLLVPVVAGLLGAVAGAVTALVAPDLVVLVDRNAGGAESAEDPLRLGIPLVDLECTGEAVLVVGRGDSTAPLAAAVANNPDLSLRYLRSDESCETLWAPSTQEPPEYAVYAGPYDGMQQPCELRMGVDHKGDAVTNLRPGNDTFVKCLCVLPVASFPVLSFGMEVDPANGIWVRSLQGMLVDLDRQREADGDPPPYFRPNDVTGVYDDTTLNRIERYQPERDIAPVETGEVRFDTWRALTDDACRLYSF
jgi:hypothetical protein